MPLSAADLEIARTSAELRNFVEDVRTSVRANRSEFKSGMSKHGYYKEFLDEVEPLCNFAEVAYPVDYVFKLVLGNQGFDAIAFDAQGNEADKIELAKPHDGAAVAVSARQVVDRGYSDLQICEHNEVLKEFIPFFEATTKAKSLKDYSSVTVVFYLAALQALAGYEGDFERKIRHFESIIAANKFKAKCVFLYVHPGRVIQIDR